MGLDYTDGCVNFRDLGEFVNLICGQDILPLNKIFRGGSIDYVKNWEEIEKAKTIINLRNGQDYRTFDAEYLHFPMSNKIEKYDTSQKEVRRWLNQIIRTFENSELEYPVLIHCLSGKDRTGIVIAALLLILEIDQDTIIEEYLLSDGEVKKDWIKQAVNGMMYLEKYFENINLETVRKNIKTLHNNA